MKKIITLLVLVMVSTIGFGQYDTAPQKMSYQAIIRDGNNELVKNTTISLKISVLAYSITGDAFYIETHSSKTNENGLLIIQIGGGQAIFGTYINGIYWGMPYFLKTEIDLLGGTNYTITSTSELLSVPVSNYAHISGALHGHAWKFVGAYTQVNQVNTDFWIEGYSFITYLGVDKISWTWKIPTVDNSQNGTLEVGEIGREHTVYGTVIGNVITFPPQNIEGELFPQMIGTLIDKKLTITYGSPEGEVLELVKE